LKIKVDLQVTSELRKKPNQNRYFEKKTAPVFYPYGFYLKKNFSATNREEKNEKWRS